ncbi:MAG: hypothetical protein O2819_01575 [Planctomycetota bacterium]|nr:hypothetical protein [Planctomycetota bacterium]MDA1105039.1 hypothetical protein [Planctomycetota bacterium]
MRDSKHQPELSPLPTRAPQAHRAFPRAFTLLELLVTIGIIVALLGVLLVGLNRASAFSKVAKTQTLMHSLMSALSQFREDTGYYPPVLGVGTASGAVSSVAGTRGFARDLLAPPAIANANAPTAAEVASVNAWWSITSLPDYFLGYDTRQFDGYGFDIEQPVNGSPGAREIPPAGIRHSGRDGVWGGALNPKILAANAIGYYKQRNPGNGASGNPNTWDGQGVRGAVLGPYLELKDSDIIGGISGADAQGEPIVLRAEETPNFDALPKCFIDYWGRPIRFYRRGYNALDPASTSTDFHLSDVVALRPQSITPGTESDGYADTTGDTSSTRALVAAEFALLSTGPDRAWNALVRVDNAGTNADNIVETGP